MGHAVASTEARTQFGVEAVLVWMKVLKGYGPAPLLAGTFGSPQEELSPPRNGRPLGVAGALASSDWPLTVSNGTNAGPTAIGAPHALL